MSKETLSIESALEARIDALERRLAELEEKIGQSGESSGQIEGSHKEISGRQESDPEPDSSELFEIISVDSRAFERDVEQDQCKFSWKVVVKSLTSRPLYLSARLEFVDMDSYLIEEDSASGFRLEPGDEAKFRGYKWISNEAEYQIVGVRAHLREMAGPESNSAE